MNARARGASGAGGARGPRARGGPAAQGGPPAAHQGVPACRAEDQLGRSQRGGAPRYAVNKYREPCCARAHPALMRGLQGDAGVQLRTSPEAACEDLVACGCLPCASGCAVCALKVMPHCLALSHALVITAEVRVLPCKTSMQCASRPRSEGMNPRFVVPWHPSAPCSTCEHIFLVGVAVHWPSGLSLQPLAGTHLATRNPSLLSPCLSMRMRSCWCRQV